MMSGRDADAERTLAEAIQWNPDHAALHVHLARLLLKRKDLAVRDVEVVARGDAR